MKHLFILSGVVCLSFMLLPACAPQAEQVAEPEGETAPEPVFDQAAEEAAIRELRERRIATYNTKDLKILEDTVVEDYENWSSDVKGRASLLTRSAARFENEWKDLTIEQLEEIGIVFVTPDVAIFKSKQDYIGLLDEAGKTMPAYRVLFAEIYVKRNDKWLTHSWYWRSIEE